MCHHRVCVAPENSKLGLSMRSYDFIHLINQSKTNLRLQNRKALRNSRFWETYQSRPLSIQFRQPKWKLYLQKKQNRENISVRWKFRKTKEFLLFVLLPNHRLAFLYIQPARDYSIFIYLLMWNKLLIPTKSLKICSSPPPKADLSHSLKEKPVSTKHLLRPSSNCYHK